MADKLTNGAINAAKTGTKLADGGCGGLYIQKTDTGGKWTFRFMIKGRRREMGLGTFPDVSVAAARTAANDARATVRSGVDPIEAKRVVPVVVKPQTLADMTARCFKAREKELRATGRWLSPLQVHILPRLGRLNVADIEQNQIHAVLEPIWRTKTSTALKCLQRLQIILTFAAATGAGADPLVCKYARVLLGDPGHKSTPLPAMPWRELPGFYAGLVDDRSDVAACLKLTILTALRSGNARLARSDWIAGGVMTVPAAHMKGREGKTSDFRIPLPRQAKAIVAVRHGLLFKGRDGVRPLSDMALTKRLRDTGWGAYTVHGFRSTFRTWAQDHDVPWEIAERSLAHQIGGEVERSYARSDLLDQRRDLMQRWADFVTSG